MATGGDPAGRPVGRTRVLPPAKVTESVVPALPASLLAASPAVRAGAPNPVAVREPEPARTAGPVVLEPVRPLPPLPPLSPRLAARSPALRPPRRRPPPRS
ncbi:hypothetical protein GCM10009838_09440 [Catenulispora subtropica]|uniref:Uncharacterized protein n=1 Tax=Catenulispora subtropica TaxID=450798 RepID=A0ABP5C2I3_9ACTN